MNEPRVEVIGVTNGFIVIVWDVNGKRDYSKGVVVEGSDPTKLGAAITKAWDVVKAEPA